MARKNLLSGLVENRDDNVSSSYPVRGASKSMIRSVNELARQADAFLEGEQVVDLNPDDIDVSFVSDRLGTDSDEFTALLEAIKERGQDSPILVRPHPHAQDRFMIVFGHRRVRVARELGRKVRAVVKVLDDKTHVIAQGQENSARANLSFIEKAIFAKNLETMGYDRETISSALATNAATVSKMISVTSRIPVEFIKLIGAAPAVGRERWVELSLVADRKSAKIEAVLLSEDFGKLETNQRFERVFSVANTKGKPIKKERASVIANSWAPRDKSVIVTTKSKAKGLTVDFGNKDGKAFGEWLSHNLEGLYETFRNTEHKQTGD